MLLQRIPSFLNCKAEIWFVSDKCYLFYLVQHFPSSLSPLASSSFSCYPNWLLLLCCKIQLPNWFNFLPFSHALHLTLPPSFSLSLSSSLFLLPKPRSSRQPCWAADNWMIWIFILNLLPYTEHALAPVHAHAAFPYFPAQLRFFRALFSFVSIFFSIKMEIVGELENCLSIGRVRGRGICFKDQTEQGNWTGGKWHRGSLILTHAPAPPRFLPPATPCC